MSRISERIGGWKRYLPPVLVALGGLALVYGPGRFGGDDPVRFWVVSGAAATVLAVAWVFLMLDRRVSDDPRYRQRPVYRDDDDPGGTGA